VKFDLSAKAPGRFTAPMTANWRPPNSETLTVTFGFTR
jgi:hypothetical protein